MFLHPVTPWGYRISFGPEPKPFFFCSLLELEPFIAAADFTVLGVDPRQAGLYQFFIDAPSINEDKRDFPVIPVMVQDFDLNGFAEHHLR